MFAARVLSSRLLGSAGTLSGAAAATTTATATTSTSTTTTANAAQQQREMKVSAGTVLNIPEAINEPIMGYRKGSQEREELERELVAMRQQTDLDLPLIIGGEEVRTGRTLPIKCPQDHSLTFGKQHLAGEQEVLRAVQAASKAREEWAALPAERRLGVFQRAADLAQGPFRQRLNAATILGQGKNFMQAEIDAACELIDFLKFNVSYAEQIYADQPYSPPGQWNRSEYRPLEGFVYALSPFNFTAIAANLVSAPAMLGNVVLWKPSDHAFLSGKVILDLYEAAGLPKEVVQYVPGDPVEVTKAALSSPELAGVHYTGSTEAFRSVQQQIANNLDIYRQYPRVVGETGGKDYMFAHPTALPVQFASGLIRAGFEYSGQKCSACSRAYVPESLWPAVRDHLVQQAGPLKAADPALPSTFVGPVIHSASFDRLRAAIDAAHADPTVEVLVGGTYDDSKGNFIDPTIVVVKDAQHEFMRKELFGPFVAIHVYDDAKLDQALADCEDSEYALTGAIWAQDPYAIQYMLDRLPYSAGNFYINDKCTGSVVGQQPFGGSRLSGTNDKAGSYLNMLRWVSARSVKETFVAPTDHTYPYMHE